MNNALTPHLHISLHVQNFGDVNGGVAGRQSISTTHDTLQWSVRSSRHHPIESAILQLLAINILRTASLTTHCGQTREDILTNFCMKVPKDLLYDFQPSFAHSFIDLGPRFANPWKAPAENANVRYTQLTIISSTSTRVVGQTPRRIWLKIAVELPLDVFYKT